MKVGCEFISTDLLVVREQFPSLKTCMAFGPFLVHAWTSLNKFVPTTLFQKAATIPYVAY